MNKKIKYKLFVMEDVFDLFTGALVSNGKINYGNIPRITATETNNGIAMFTNEIDDKNFRTYRNFISISFLGDVYYQENKVSLDMKIHGAKPKEKSLNKYIAHYLIPLIRNFSSKYSYGNQLSMRLLKRQKINLPINEKEEPDWGYMENQGELSYKKQKESIKFYLLNKRESLDIELNDIKRENYNIDSVQWGTFKVDELFNAQRVKGKTLDSYEKGKYPYVTTSAENNGVTTFVKAPEEDREPSNSLTINPISGDTFYQSHEFVGRGGAGSSIYSLENNCINKYSGLFISKMLMNSAKAKASYGVQLNGNRLKSTRFMLPILDNGEPDWEYMENYIKKIEYKQLAKLINYFS